MSVFHESIKQILSDVSKFLNSTLSDDGLSKTAQKEKAKILESLQKLYEEYEVLNPNVEDGSSTSSKDDSKFTTGSVHSQGSEEDANSDNIPYTTVKALPEKTMWGFLQKKPTDLLEKLSKSKKYCVISKNILYWFKKSTDKTHQGACYLTSYEFKDISQNDKDFVFELYASKKKCYQFQADNKEDMKKWKKAIETGAKFVEPIQEDLDEYSGEDYEPIEEVVNAVKAQQAASLSAANLPPPPILSLPPIPSSPEPQEEYAEGFSMPAQIKAKDKKANTHAKSNITIEEFEDDDDNLIYEFVESPPSDLDQTATANEFGSTIPETPPPRPPPSPLSQPSQGPPPLPSRGLPPISSAPMKSAAQPPPPKKMQPALDKILSLEDYENLFYSIWSCTGDCDNELSFDRGDIIHVLNRDLDSGNWWIGESRGNIGLVPKEFLTPAYEMVA